MLELSRTWFGYKYCFRAKNSAAVPPKEIVNVLLSKSLSGAQHLHGIRESPVGMRIVAADHHPVGADAFGDVGPCRIVRAEREIEIAETFFGATPRLLSCGRAGVVGGFEAIHQPRNKPDADFEETPAKFWKAIDHATKDQR